MSSPYKTVALHTFGCKANFADTSLLNSTFDKKGYNVVPFESIADIYIINTCSVTDNANKKCRRFIKKIKRRVPNSVIGVTGCYAQLKPDEIIDIPEVNFVVGMHDKYNFIDKIDDITKNDKLVFHSNNIRSIDNAFLAYSLDERTRSFVKIQDGCDYVCSYCTIPLARGKSRSSRISEVVDHIKDLDSNNVKEIILSGINVGDFGQDNNESFIDLLKAINTSTNIPRIRISSIEPNLITDQIIDFIASNSKFMPHLHIPLQSGSDKILKKMRRRYNVSSYRDKIFKIKDRIKDCTIGVDVMVGFPGESEDDFNNTYNLLHDLPVSYFHVFPFSERENTMAADMVDSIPLDVRYARAKILRKLSKMKFQNIQEESIGKIRPVLFEMSDEDYFSGLTDNYIRVKVLNNNTIDENSIHNINLLEIKGEQIIGELA
tara:strand:+ start:929 stop:2227 length:1299 start_codon:yes stop_codon:yes gene_type:complete